MTLQGYNMNNEYMQHALAIYSPATVNYTEQ